MALPGTTGRCWGMHSDAELNSVSLWSSSSADQQNDSWF
jgi:hypothetical protein